MERRMSVCAAVVAGVFSLAVLSAAREIGVTSSDTSSGRMEYEAPAVVEVRGRVKPSASPPVADSIPRWVHRNKTIKITANRRRRGCVYSPPRLEGS